ncbi:hypothetical protein [Runella sp.]|uniref:hypothetical protein n=1 Tax=Runella sp. TaxID=1960881 RepID=UPI003D0D021E
MAYLGALRFPRLMGAIRCRLLTIIYFDQGNDIVLEFNTQETRMIGSYELDKGGTMKALRRYPSNKKDTLLVKLSLMGKQNTVSLSGKLGKDSLQAVLSPVKQLH